MHNSNHSKHDKTLQGTDLHGNHGNGPAELECFRPSHFWFGICVETVILKNLSLIYTRMENKNFK